MDKVRMKHPDLDREIDVLAPAVEHHRRSGWELVNDSTDKVRLEHPDVAGTIEVPASGVEAHRRAGWSPAESAGADTKTTELPGVTAATGEQTTTTAPGSDPGASITKSGRRVPGRDGATD